MKFFKSTLAIVALLGVNPVFAAKKPTGAKKTTSTTTTTTPITSAMSYSAMLAKIKTMPAAQVIDNAGNKLQPAFVKSIIENPSLSRTEAEALLQAGVNRHATWNGNDAQDKKKLQTLSLQVERNANAKQEAEGEFVMGELFPKALPKTPTKRIDEGEYMDVPDLFTTTSKPLPATPAPKFYNVETAMLNQNYLNNRINELTSKYPSAKIKQMLEQEFVNPMLRQWADRGINNPVKLTKVLKEQINDAVDASSQEQRAKTLPSIPTLPEPNPIWSLPTPMNATDSSVFYDPATNLLKKDFLKEEIKHLLDQNIKSDRMSALNTLKEMLFNMISPEWKNRGISERLFRPKLSTQIDDAYYAALKIENSQRQLKLATPNSPEGEYMDVPELFTE